MEGEEEGGSALHVSCSVLSAFTLTSWQCLLASRPLKLRVFLGLSQTCGLVNVGGLLDPQGCTRAFQRPPEHIPFALGLLVNLMFTLYLIPAFDSWKVKQFVADGLCKYWRIFHHVSHKQGQIKTSPVNKLILFILFNYFETGFHFISQASL